MRNYLNDAWTNDECLNDRIIWCTICSYEWNMKWKNSTYTHFTRTSHLAYKNNYKQAYYNKNEECWNDHINFDDQWLTCCTRKQLVNDNEYIISKI